MANPNIVSVTSIYGGNYGWNLTATTTSTLLVVDAEKLLKINRIVCTNVHASTAYDLDLSISVLGIANANGLTVSTGQVPDAIVYLAKTISIPADSSLVVSDTPIYLMAGNTLRGGSGTVDVLDLFISYEVIADA